MPSWASDWASASRWPSRSSVTGSWRSGRAATRSSTASSAPPNAESDDSDTRSLAKVVRASFQPPSISPTTQSSGTKQSSKKTSLNRAAPVISRSGRTSMPGRVHVDQEVGDAPVLGHVGVGPGQADAPVGPRGHRRPHLLAGQRPPAVDPGRPGGQRGQVGAGARLAEELAPDDLAPQRRPHEPLGLLGGAVGHDRGKGPGGHGQAGSLETGLGAGLVDDQLLDRPGVPAPRASASGGPGGRGRPGPAGARPDPRRRRWRPTRASISARSAAGLGWQVDRQAPAPAGQGQPGRLGPERCGAAHQLAQGGGPAEVDVGVVLPREAHPPEDLDGALGRLDVAVEGQGGGELHGQAPLVRLLPRGRAPLGLEDHGGVPGGGHGLLHGDQHVGQPVLDPLELADRPAELLAGAGVLGRRVHAPSGPADRLGRQDDEGEVPHGAGRGVEHPLPGHGRPVQGPRRGRPGQVEAGQLASPRRRRPARGRPSGSRRRPVTGASTWETTAPCTRGRSTPVTTSEPSGPGTPGQTGVGDGRAVGRRRGHGQRGGQAAVGQAGQERLGQDRHRPQAATTPATTAVVSHGPTAAARPSSSATTASSTTPAPCPPRSSSRWMASSPWAARSPQ